MREYLFRGKPKHFTNHDKVKVEWVYGNLQLLENKTIVWVADRAVIPETVGQYTGLDDINGKQIFEGDIVRICCGHEDETTINEILFDNGEWEAHDIGGDYDSLYNQIVNCEHEVEIIGNIHDNGLLLEVKNAYMKGREI